MGGGMGLSPVSADEVLTEAAVEGNQPVAGKSPTQIALQRLRQDKVALVCIGVLVILVLLAIFAPLITKAMGIYWDVTDPNAPTPSEVIDFDGFPLVGPPFHAWDPHHP